MGLSLFNRRICDTYDGVIKTCDNASISVTPKPMTDGLGNDVPINIGTSTICYTGTQDFTGATVVGISGATAGLVSGVGTNSMISSSGLATLATADGSCSISIGNGAYNDQQRSISIGQGATGLCEYSLAMGFGSTSNGLTAISIGDNTGAVGGSSIAFGSSAQANGSRATALGPTTSACADNAIAVGYNAGVFAANGIAIGCDADVSSAGNGSISLGFCARSQADKTIAIGYNTTVLNVTAFESIVMGNGATSRDAYGVVLGAGAQTCINGEGSIVIGKTSTAVQDESIAIGAIACAEGRCGIAIGSGTIACGNQSMAIGHQSITCGTNCNFTIAIGNNVESTGFAVGIGRNVTACYNSFVMGVNACAIQSGVSVGTGCAFGVCSIAIGLIATTTLTGSRGIAIGCNACVTHNAAAAIGDNVFSTRANVLTTCEFESCVAGCGLIVKTPNGLNSYRIAVDNSGNITTALA